MLILFKKTENTVNILSETAIHYFYASDSTG